MWRRQWHHCNTLAWKSPWREEPGRLQSMGSLRVRHDWVLHFHFSLSCIGEGNGNPLQCSCLENSRDGGAWWAAIRLQTCFRHNWSDLAEAAAANTIWQRIRCYICSPNFSFKIQTSIYNCLLYFQLCFCSNTVDPYTVSVWNERVYFYAVFFFINMYCTIHVGLNLRMQNCR